MDGILVNFGSVR